MNIVYASDDNFADVMCVSIMSFNDHNSDATIYVLDCGIAEHNKQKILELCSGKNTVLFVDAKKALKKLPYGLNLDRGSIAAYARLFVGTMLPENVTKVLYLDCDTLIRGSLQELFEFDITPYVIGGVRDAFSVWNKRVFGIKKGGLFVNSGVILIDLNRWRSEIIEEKISSLLVNKKKIYQGDQGVINSIFHGDVYELPLKYNVLTYLYDFTYEEMMLYRKPDCYFDKVTVQNNALDPVIVHFSSSFRSYRPWQCEKTKHLFYDEWNSVYKLVTDIKRDDKNRSSFVSLKFILVPISFVHAYLRPLKNYFLQ